RPVLGACQAAEDRPDAAARAAWHPLGQAVRTGGARWGERLSSGDREALELAERLRGALVSSLEAGPLVRDTLARLHRELEEQLDDPSSALSRLIDRRLQSGIVPALDDPGHRAPLDRWGRATAHALPPRP